MVMKEGERPREAFILKREPTTVQVRRFCWSSGNPPSLASRMGERSISFARWLVDPNNPLTARVTVNRLWQQLYGIGIVKTVEDFGTQGEGREPVVGLARSRIHAKKLESEGYSKDHRECNLSPVLHDIEGVGGEGSR